MLASVWNSADQSETAALVTGVLLVLIELVIAAHGLWEICGGKNKADIFKKHLPWMALVAVVFGAANFIFSQISNKLSAREQASKIAATDPHNQTVSSISASVVIHVYSPIRYSAFRRRDPRLDAGYLALFWANMTDRLRPSMNEFGSLRSDSMKVWESGDAFVLEMKFYPRALLSPKIARTNESCTVREFLSVVDSLSIYATQLTNDMDVIGGHAELVVNGNVRKIFGILEDKKPAARMSGFDNSLHVIATNSASSVRKHSVGR